jgi:hypothetical protein
VSDPWRHGVLIHFGQGVVAYLLGTMPFRLLSASPARCRAVTRSGAQCAINAGSAFRDSSGKLVSEPLRRGGPHCMFHMSLFETRVAHVSGDVLVFYIDFETTGLDVLALTGTSTNRKLPTHIFYALFLCPSGVFTKHL